MGVTGIIVVELQSAARQAQDLVMIITEFQDILATETDRHGRTGRIYQFINMNDCLRTFSVYMCTTAAAKPHKWGSPVTNTVQMCAYVCVFVDTDMKQ